MAKKSTTLYVCANCGEEFLQWQGRCSNCGEWNTLKEFSAPSEDRRERVAGVAPAKPIRLTEISQQGERRLPTGFGEVDRVLGGGIVPGSVILLGGDPGIGKSTLLLQLVEKMAGSLSAVLYVSGEESAEQIKLRAERVGVASHAIQVLAATSIDAIQAVVEQEQPKLLVIDSIQTMYDPTFPSTPGSIVQVRETALRLQQLAKKLHLPTILVGHITKEGTIAGPRTLEHLVDVVLYLEGEPEQPLRILRAVKNRFGDVSETGIFAMEEQGLQEVRNPSSFLLSERVVAPGTVLTAVLEGSRPVLVEVQALTIPSRFGYPKRTSLGFDLNRLNVLLAVLERRAKLAVSNHDVFVNIVGGLKTRDPAIDLAVCLAVASSVRGKALPEKLCLLGEVGLAGELRRVNQEERRRKEVESLGYLLPPPAKSLQEVVQGLLGAKE